MKTEQSSESAKTNERQEDLDLPLFDLDTILNATNEFSRNNKLGEGGFGPVYKVRICSSFILILIHCCAVLKMVYIPSLYDMEG